VGPLTLQIFHILILKNNFAPRECGWW